MSIYRQPVITVTVDGAALTDVVSASVSLGLSSQIASAEIGVHALPAGLLPWSAVVVTLGATAATAAVRFTGYFIEARQALYPSRIMLSCRGKLVLAELHENETELDLSDGGTGATDEVMVSTLLYHAGLSGAWTPADAPTAMADIGGTGKTLGTIAKDAAFTWFAGASPMAFINVLDGVCLGYRTYDTFDGTIKRTQLVMIPSITSAATFTEHVDIASAQETQTIAEVSNRIVVTGFPGLEGNAPITYTAETNNPFLQVAGVPWYVTSNLGSGVIEKQNTADAGDGLSCEEIALWLLAEKNRYREFVDLTTPRDDVIAPGDTITVQAPTRLGMTNRRFWVESLTVGIDEGGAFSQTLRCLAAIPVTLLLEDGDYILTEAGDYLESE